MKLDGSSLATVDTSTGECAKPNCQTGSHTLHRHHHRHEAMWLGVWSGHRKGEKKFEKFVTRYYEFNPKDWTRLCDSHHAEIHLVYDGVIRRDQRITGRPLARYSWKQAETLMDKLESVFFDWLKTESPGADSKKLDKMRAKRRRGRPLTR